ncbi:MAG: Fic family protein [Duganella sp.]
MDKIGFTWLCDHFAIQAAPLTHESYIGGRRRIDADAHQHCVVEYFAANYRPEPAPMAHLEFALKYDDLHLDLLKKIFEHIPPSEIVAYIEERPSSKYSRQIGFLYEFLTNKILPLSKAVSGNYADLLDGKRYVVATPTRNARWLINDNLLGTPQFCPVIRKTAFIRKQVDTDYTSRLKSFQGDIPPDLFRRAIDYLYFKESKSSYDIERETATPDREAKFVEALKRAGSVAASVTLTEQYLAELQSVIVDARFAHDSFRTWQNYVGQNMLGRAQRIHYVCPPGMFVHSLMEGLAQAAIKAGGINPVIRAAIISFGFVFIHPFEDGNGRLHRFLIHDTLAHDKFVPEGMILPVSAYMLRNTGEYDAVLERYSRPLSRLVDYTLNHDDEMTVNSPGMIEGYYRYPDMTPQVEYLFYAVEQTISTELIAEVLFLQHYDEAREKIQAIVDLPDRQLDLMIKLLHQNNGTLSKAKRSRFPSLHDDEILAMESAYRSLLSTAEPVMRVESKH